MRPPPATASSTAAADDGESQSPTSSRPSSSSHQLLFKKHKVLPHPRKDASYANLRGPRSLAPSKNAGLALANSAASSSVGGLSDDASITPSQPSSPRTKKQYPKTLGNGPDLPPTPPAHSRNSSATYSALPSSVTYVQSPERSAEDVQLKPALPTTPTKQLSPPTPDVTPPHAIQHNLRPKGPAVRPPLRDRNMSKSTADSRTASFITARENPSSSSSDNEDSFASLRPAPISERMSESTVRHLVAEQDETPKKRQPKVVGLGLGLESSPEESITPKSKREPFVSFDGEWGSSSEEVVKEWDDNLQRNVAVRHHKTANRNATGPVPRNEVIEDVTVTPTNAAKAVRSMSLPQRILTFPSPNDSIDQTKTQAQQAVQQQRQQQSAQQPQRQQRQHRRQQNQSQQQRRPSEQSREQPLASAAPIVAQMAPTASLSTNDRGARVSTASASSKSTVSAVVEAALVGTPPQRQRTLRHVKKQVTLRDSGLDLSPASSATTSLLAETTRQRRPNGGRFNSNGHDSIVSTTSMNSVSSRSARREIWKAGGIPVIVVPSRLSSVRSTSREPSLRSTSSRRSNRSQSLHSAPPSHLSKSREVSPYMDQRSRGSRAYSESQGSSRNSFARDGSAPGDQRTIDFPPTIPMRSSSLSAPTSRNVSRSGSLTAESVHAHSAILRARLKDQEKPQPNTELKVRDQSPAAMPAQQVEHPVEPERPETKNEVFANQDAQRSESLLLRDIRNEQNSPTEQTVLPRLADKCEERQDDVPKNDLGNIHGDDGNYDHRNHLDPRSSLDRHVDRYSSRHLSPHNTPFSMVSVETTTTHHSHAEVSEALAVNIYPHQNTSVLVVDHSNRPSDCSDDSQPDRLTDDTGPSSSKQESSPASEFASAITPSSVSAPPPDRPRITKTDHDAAEDLPVTPSHQQLFSLDDVDSPLRNPRAPPMPPAINFIPATPSGLTPATEQERNMGNYFEEAGATDGRPRRRRSVSAVVRNALGRGRSTTRDYGPSASRSGGLLTRTLSLTRDISRRAFSVRRSESVDRRRGESFDIDRPAEEDKLHPFWRPASQQMDDDDDEYYHHDYDQDETYRYPPIDNRPRGPRRSLSMRMKKTFAILPDRTDDFYPATGDETLDRRTVRRTPSGNLRVVKHHGSTESLGEYSSSDIQRPYTAPERQGSRKFRFWRSPSLTRKKRYELSDNNNNNSYNYTGADDYTTTSTTNNYDSSNAAHEDEVTGAAAGEERRQMKILPNLGLGDKIGEYGPHTIPRRFSERRREKRSNELRQMISGPQEVRDGVGEVIRRTNYRDAFTQAQAS